MQGIIFRSSDNYFLCFCLLIAVPFCITLYQSLNSIFQPSKNQALQAWPSPLCINSKLNFLTEAHTKSLHDIKFLLDTNFLVYQSRAIVGMINHKAGRWNNVGSFNLYSKMLGDDLQHLHHLILADNMFELEWLVGYRDSVRSTNFFHWRLL